MLDFSPYEERTGGDIDDWYVDTGNHTSAPDNKEPRLSNFEFSGQHFKTLNIVTENSHITANNQNDYFGNAPIWDDSQQDYDTQSAVERKCNERLELLAESYSASNIPDYYRNVQARIKIVEKQLDSLLPRYNELDWELLLKFNQSINELKKE